MDAQVKRTQAEEGFISRFESAQENLPGVDWVAKLRQDAFDTFTTRGLPHRRVEEWKYTDLRARLKEAFPQALSETVSRDTLAKALGAELNDLDAYKLVIANGVFSPELSDLDGLAGKIECLPMADALSASPDWLKEQLGVVNNQPDDAVISLNTALMSDGIALRLSEGTQIDKPVHIVNMSMTDEPSGVCTRNLVYVGGGVKVTLIESHVSAGGAPVQANSTTELVAEDGAEIDHVKFQDEHAETAHLSNWMVRLGADVTYRAFQFSLGSSLARNQLFVRFAGEGSSSHISSAVMGRDSQHNDTTMVIDHAVPSCESRELCKLVLDGEAQGVVQCKVNVHKDAQKSDGHQMAQALLLSERAEFDSKPELEIFADDVVCGHGSTSGQVDEELLFYLRARGIPEDKARALLIAAFVGEVIEKVEHEGLREIFQGKAEQWLAGEGA